jgi:hypothetical protein
MSRWEYKKIDLNDAPRSTDDIDLLNDAGVAGWEVIAITSNSIAYLKRPSAKPTTRTSTRSTAK